MPRHGTGFLVTATQCDEFLENAVARFASLAFFKQGQQFPVARIVL